MQLAMSMAYSVEGCPAHIQRCSRILLDVDKPIDSRSFSLQSDCSAKAETEMSGMSQWRQTIHMHVLQAGALKPQAACLWVGKKVQQTHVKIAKHSNLQKHHNSLQTCKWKLSGYRVDSHGHSNMLLALDSSTDMPPPDMLLATLIIPIKTTRVGSWQVMLVGQMAFQITCHTVIKPCPMGSRQSLLVTHFRVWMSPWEVTACSLPPVVHRPLGKTA